MIKLTILLICFTVFTVSCQGTDFDTELDSVYHKTMNETKFHNKPTDRSKSKSNMRRSSEFAKTVHDIFTFVQEYNNTSVRRKRQVVGYTINSTYCPYQNVKITCNSTYKYRSYDGTCNNLVKPLIGAANVPYVRLLPPAYQDGVNSPRSLSLTGQPLPNPRSISLGISLPSSTQRLSKVGMTQIYAFFGQFLTHDLGGTSTTTDQFGNEINCPCGTTNSNCVSFTVPANDSYLGLSCQNTGNSNVGQANLQCITDGFSNQTCITQTRSSATFPTLDCKTSYREQLNLLSAYIDGSAIYGINSSIANQLRTFTKGLLKTSNGLSGATTVPGEILTNRSYLPLSNDNCSTSTKTIYKCFLAGEYRTSENLGLVGMQTLFNREHNRVATALAKINPLWNDETLYQESRRIVIAELQHITYNEFLPLINGNNSLSPLNTNTYYTGYDSTVDPQLSGEFSTAAFRMGHSLIRQKLGRSNINQNYTGFTNNYFPSYNFYTSLFQSDMAYNTKTEGLNGIFLATINDIAWKFGTFGYDLQNNLFQKTFSNGTTISADLLALNINRGRDHGLQPYVNYIKMCFNVTISSFTDLSPTFMNQFNAAQLQSLYQNVNDIDLYAGGLSEVITGSNQQFTVGPTFGCIIMNQFDMIKRGDRFWYENGPSTSPSAFTLPQLQEIKTVTMAGLICKNYDIYNIQQQAFFYPSSNPDSVINSPNNPILSCKSSQLAGQLNLDNWAA